MLSPCTGVNITKAQCQLCAGFHWALSNHEPKEMNLHLWNTQIQQEVLAAGKAGAVASQQSEPGKGGLVGTSHLKGGLTQGTSVTCRDPPTEGGAFTNHFSITSTK